MANRSHAVCQEGRRPHLVADLVADAAGKQEEEDGEREEEDLQAAVDAQRLDEEDEG